MSVSIDYSQSSSRRSSSTYRPVSPIISPVAPPPSRESSISTQAELSSSRSASTPMSAVHGAKPKAAAQVQPTNDTRIKTALKNIGFAESKKLSDTLQGSVWRCTLKGKDSPSVVKVTNKKLHDKCVGVVDGKCYDVKENILKEQSILRYLSECEDCPDSIAKFEQFYRSNVNYYLQMEDGGHGLFEFVKRAHHFIKHGDLEWTEWQKLALVIAKQMIECVAFIHSHNVVHFDLSLENFLINDVQVEVDEYADKSTKIRFVTDNVQIKLCDFGLAEQFAKSKTGRKCWTNKSCGKAMYKSPEATAKQKRFDAKSNDVWCLTVCLFAIVVGSFPFGSASESDRAYAYVRKHSIGDLLGKWKLAHLVDSRWMRLFESVLQVGEDDRITIDEMKEYASVCLFV